jgi:hypothetical protein
MALIQINFMPFEDRKKQFIQLFQEMVILLISYSLICFTGYVEPEVASIVGDFTTVIMIA